MNGSFHQLSGATEMSTYAVIYEMKQTQKAYKKASLSMVISFCEALLSAYIASELSKTDSLKNSINQLLNSVGISGITTKSNDIYLVVIPVVFILLFICLRLMSSFFSWINNEFLPKATQRKREDLIELVNKRLLNVVLLAADLENKYNDSTAASDTRQLYSMQAFTCLNEAEKLISSSKLVEIYNRHMRGNIKFIKELNPLFLIAIIDTATNTLERLKANNDQLADEITALKRQFNSHNQVLKEYSNVGEPINEGAEGKKASG